LIWHEALVYVLVIVVSSLETFLLPAWGVNEKEFPGGIFAGKFSFHENMSSLR